MSSPRTLTELNQCCTKLTNEALKAIAANCPLKILAIRNCNFTDAGIKVMKANCPSLKALKAKRKRKIREGRNGLY